MKWKFEFSHTENLTTILYDFLSCCFVLFSVALYVGYILRCEKQNITPSNVSNTVEGSSKKNVASDGTVVEMWRWNTCEVNTCSCWVVIACHCAARRILWCHFLWLQTFCYRCCCCVRRSFRRFSSAIQNSFTPW